MINHIRKLLVEPRVRNLSVDSNTLLTIHRKILEEKPLLNSAFISFYKSMTKLCDKYFISDGIEVELGSGAGFFKKYRKNLITSDIRSSTYIDINLDAHKMIFKKSSVKCIYAINVFHHLKDPDTFFKELIRVLKPGGGCILIEPHNGFFSSFAHKNLHKNESFLPNQKNWKNLNIKGPLSGANQALSFIVFKRDIKRFNKLYGKSLELVYQGYCSCALRYFFSGGVNFRQLFPFQLEFLLKFIEFLATPIIRIWSLHQIIVIRKKFN
jgi:SAM-dependent methyltransferase